MNDSLMNHRCTLAGYPHIAGTIRGMYSPDNAYVIWDAESLAGAYCSYPVSELTILDDVMPPLPDYPLPDTLFPPF